MGCSGCPGATTLLPRRPPLLAAGRAFPARGGSARDREVSGNGSGGCRRRGPAPWHHCRLLRRERQVHVQTVQGKDAGATGVGRFTWLHRPDDSRGWETTQGETPCSSDARPRPVCSRSSYPGPYRGGRVRFSPAEPMLIPGLKPGESRRVKIAVGVSISPGPDRQTHSGFLDVVYTYVRTYAVTVPAGSSTPLLKWTYVQDRTGERERRAVPVRGRRGSGSWRWWKGSMSPPFSSTRPLAHCARAGEAGVRRH